MFPVSVHVIALIVGTTLAGTSHVIAVFVMPRSDPPEYVLTVITSALDAVAFGMSFMRLAGIVQSY